MDQDKRTSVVSDRASMSIGGAGLAMLGIFALAWIVFGDARTAATVLLVVVAIVGAVGLGMYMMYLGNRGIIERLTESMTSIQRSNYTNALPSANPVYLPPARQRVTVPVLNAPHSTVGMVTPTSEGDIEADPELLAFIAEHCYDRPSRPAVANRLRMAGQSAGSDEIDAALDWFGAHSKLTRPAGQGGSREWMVGRTDLLTWLSEQFVTYGVDQP